MDIVGRHTVGTGSSPQKVIESLCSIPLANFVKKHGMLGWAPTQGHIPSGVPGLGDDFGRLVMIVSRASGVPVIANAVMYVAELVRGDWRTVLDKELAAARAAGLDSVAPRSPNSPKTGSESAAVAAPPME